MLRRRAHNSSTFLGHNTPKSLAGAKGVGGYGKSHRPFALLVKDERMERIVYGRSGRMERKIKRDEKREEEQRAYEEQKFTKDVDAFSSDLYKLKMTNVFLGMFFNSVEWKNAAWFREHGLLAPVDRKYLERHEISAMTLSDKQRMESIEALFRNATSPITRAFAVKWFESKCMVRKKIAEEQAPMVMGETGNPKATAADLQAFANDWECIKRNIFRVAEGLEALQNKGWLADVAEIMGELADKKVSNPKTLQEYLNRLDGLGILDNSEDFDFALCRKIANEKIGSGLAGALGAAQSPITKEIVWRIFNELGWVEEALEERRATARELDEAAKFTGKEKQEGEGDGGITGKMRTIAQQFLTIGPSAARRAMDGENISATYIDLRNAAEEVVSGKPVGEKELRYMKLVVEHIDAAGH